MFPPDRDSLVGKKLGVYRIEAKLGSGGMGDVYRAVNETLGRQVAIKTLKATIAADSTMLRRFFDEARVVNDIRHENIVDVTDLYPAERLGEPSYMVMELLEGATLAQAIRQSGRIAPRRCVFIAAQIADAIAAAHRKGVIHRDLKPDNVFLIRRMGTPDYVKILDFGIARLQGDSDGLGVTKSGAVIGTPAYMSPEQAMSEKVTSAADIYTLGVIIFHMLTGRLPFEGPSLPEVMIGHMRMAPPPVHTLSPQVPGRLADVVARMLAKAPADRPASMEEVRHLLLGALGMDPRLSLAELASLAATGDRDPPGAHAMWDGATLDATGHATGQPGQPVSVADQAGYLDTPAGPPARQTVTESPAAAGAAGTAPGFARDHAAAGRTAPGYASPSARIVPARPGEASESLPGAPGASGASGAPGASGQPALPALPDDPSQLSQPSGVVPASGEAGVTENLRVGAAGRASATPLPTPSGLVIPPTKKWPRWATAGGVLAAAMAGALGYFLFATGRGGTNVVVTPDSPTPARDADAILPVPSDPTPRERLDHVVRTFEEPAAPLDCQTRDSALLGRLVEVTELLRQGEPGGQREGDVTARDRLSSQSFSAAEYWYWLGKARLYAGDGPAAMDPVIDAARQAIALCPTYAAAHHLLGIALFRDDRLDDAEREFLEAEKLSPDFASARLNLGLVELKAGKVDQAIASFGKVIDGDPDNASALISRALAYIKARQPEQAMADLDRARQLDPRRAADAFWLLAQANEAQGDTEKAQRAMCMAARLGHAEARKRCKQ